MTTLVGRNSESDAIRQLLERVTSGPEVLVLAGEAGIGKTVIWQAGIAEARQRGFTTLTCRPAASDLRLSYSGISDLLADVKSEMFHRLPRPQCIALEAALLRSPIEHPSPDPRAVAAGFLSTIEALASRAPLLLGIDDIQWLDESSRQVVEFAVRRCRGPLAVLVARRIQEGHSTTAELRPFDPARLRTIRLGPLDLSDLRLMLRQNIGHSIPSWLMMRISEVSGGNPFFALELARGLDKSYSGDIVLPNNLQEAVRDRLDRLDQPVRAALQVAAALVYPRIELVDQALESYDTVAQLTAAEDDGVIILAADGSIRFTHPLLAAGAYSGMSPGRRRELHRKLSSVVDDPEERARHLALATIGPDPATVLALDNAANHARRRGAPAASARLLEMSIRLGAGDPERLVEAAHDYHGAGNPSRARELLELALAELSSGELRARALGRLGVIRFESDASQDAVELLEQAVFEAGSDPELRCSLRMDLSFVLFINGRIPEAHRHIKPSIQEAEQSTSNGLLAEALTGSVIHDFLTGRGTDEIALARALELEDPGLQTPVRRWPSTVAAQIYRWTHRLEESLAAYAEVRQRCIDRGLESDLWFVSLGAIPAACWAGKLETARQLLDDTLERAWIVESDFALGIARLFEAQYAAWTGEIERTRHAAAEASEYLAAGGVSTIGLEIPASLGMAELSVGDYDAAARHLGPAAEAAIAMNFSEPASAQFLPDAAEALIALDRVEDAEPIIELLEASGRNPDRPWARAVGARCRGLLLAANGQLADAATAYQQSLLAHDDLPQLRYDRARTLLAQAALQRRRKQRRAARTSLLEAVDLFEQVGAAQWATRARSEIDRLGMSPGAGDGLTPSEEHIARLAASGMTNREIAAMLFISPKTVEAHLTRIYAKLEIHSRAELGWRMAERSQNRDSG